MLNAMLLKATGKLKVGETQLQTQRRDNSGPSPLVIKPNVFFFLFLNSIAKVCSYLMTRFECIFRSTSRHVSFQMPSSNVFSWGDTELKAAHRGANEALRNPRSSNIKRKLHDGGAGRSFGHGAGRPASSDRQCDTRRADIKAS